MLTAVILAGAPASEEVIAQHSRGIGKQKRVRRTTGMPRTVADMD